MRLSRTNLGDIFTGLTVAREDCSNRETKSGYTKAYNNVLKLNNYCENLEKENKELKRLLQDAIKSIGHYDDETELIKLNQKALEALGIKL